jgi:Aminoglycoside-2''-adenylyltransferase
MNTPGLDAWQPWTPEEVFHRFKGISAPWCVVGGWAIDLWLGRQTREHEDIEISVLREDLGQFRAALPECDFFAASGGKVEALGLFERADDIHQVWCLDRETQSWRLDIMIEPGTRVGGSYGTWLFKRDATITIPRSTMTKHNAIGIPYMIPSVVLLFKAKHVRNKDEADFEAVLPKFLNEQSWLVDALERVHPGHPWIGRLKALEI